jgi:hypothetical protein
MSAADSRHGGDGLVVVSATGVYVMVKYTRYRVSVWDGYISGAVGICSKGRVICRIVYLSDYGDTFIVWGRGKDAIVQRIGNGCGVLIGCHCVNVYTVGCKLVIDVPKALTLCGMAQ